MIALYIVSCILAYFVIGTRVSIVGIRRDWSSFVTEMEKRPGAAIILVLWPIYLFLRGSGAFLEWIVTVANPAKFKQNH